MELKSMRRTMMAAICAVLCFAAIHAVAGDTEDIRGTFERFVAAQNAHDTEKVASILKEGEDFLWVTRGSPVWGRDAAMMRFGALYQGTWHLEPTMSEFRVIALGPGVAQIFVPVAFQIGPAGQPAQPAKFLMNQTLVKVSSEWRITSILPIPLPP
jgi:hypothetical protein